MSKSIFNGGILSDIDNGQPFTTLIPSVTYPPSSPSFSSLVSRPTPTPTPSPNRKV